ncbi:MAG: N-acetylmuramoyl-L-alanine amidase [Clostridia bacterium]|nr:N-acetylmuramoyl-L-alanine amidase [Clostridia bacterium]
MTNKLFVIPGHGAGDSGAVGNGYKEAERVRALATKVKEYGGDNVILSDFNLNSYRSNIIGKCQVPNDCLILELHIDSSKNTKARGGHVIINANFKADEYDDALAKMISTIFPGRAKTIVGRTDLANVRRAAEKGYNYRLLECCFISNIEDINKFNAEMDKLAKEILGCFKISVTESAKSATTTKKSNEEIAREVIKGLWGNGITRKLKLAKAGYNYAEIQKRVNELLKRGEIV